MKIEDYLNEVINSKDPTVRLNMLRKKIKDCKDYFVYMSKSTSEIKNSREATREMKNAADLFDDILQSILKAQITIEKS
jgi:response regulator RpfG family c-di-GMP phosphodiesterase